MGGKVCLLMDNLEHLQRLHVSGDIAVHFVSLVQLDILNLMILVVQCVNLVKINLITHTTQKKQYQR